MSVRYWSAHTKETHAMRDRAIVKARADGAKVAEIAEAAEMSRQAVYALLANFSAETLDK